VGQAPRPQVDPWDRLAQRLAQKAKQTMGAGPTWIRIDESAQLYMFTRLDKMVPEQQLGYIVQPFQLVLAPFPHVRGIVLSFGAEPWFRVNEPEITIMEGRPNPWAGHVMVDRGLPGPRRRRTFVVPIEGGQRLAFPDQIELTPARWYAQETGWLDWGLQRLGLPLSRTFASQTGEVSLTLGAFDVGDDEDEWRCYRPVRRRAKAALDLAGRGLAPELLVRVTGLIRAGPVVQDEPVAGTSAYNGHPSFPCLLDTRTAPGP